MNCNLTSNGTCFTLGVDNIVIEGKNYSITGNTTGYGIEGTGRNNVTIKNIEIYNFSYGVYFNNSDFNEIINNEIINNTNTGVYFSSTANNNTLTGNFICENAVDVNNSNSNSGDKNICSNVDGWNDAETTGCTFTCQQYLCDLNHDGIYVYDWEDLMLAYKCFLGIENNCDTINYQNWTLMKQEYQCFVNNQEI